MSSACPAHAQWVKKPSAGLLARTPGLLHETFDSAAMKATVGYSVVLPPDYDSGRQRYPVVYWLHGGGGNECSSVFTSQSWHDLCRSNTIEEIILVYPNGFRSGYMDHHDGHIMVESMIINELIPRIDQRFRTIVSREGRAVHGYSMGASGALKIAIKYPGMFCAAVAYGGGAVDLQNSNSDFILNILERNLKSNPNLIRQNNTYHFLKRNHDVVRRNGTQFLLICGERDFWKTSAVTFQTALQDRNIPCKITLVPDVGHDLRGLCDAEGTAAAVFQDAVFREASPAVAWVAEASTLSESYTSKAEGRKQQYQLTLPPGYSPNEQYPLFVQVFGSAAMLPTSDRPFIRVRPHGRGVWGYRSMSRYDVLQVIEHAKSAYNVDEDRVYITGTSAGATGVMHTAAYRPDVFAGVVPLVAFGNDLPLENFRNLPIRCEHGVNDWTSAICNVRVQFQKLADMGYDAVLNEHPTAGHGTRSPPDPTMDWLFDQERDRSPQHIVYSCEHPRDGRAYWIRIDDFLDPHRVARVEAQAAADSVTVITRNIRTFSIDLTNAPWGRGQELTIDGTSVECAADAQHDPSAGGATAPESPAWLTFTRSDGWQVQSPTEATSPRRRQYGAGAAANVFQGEPLLVIHGTGSDDRENQFLQQAANVLAQSGGPHFKPAHVQFPVRADSSLTDVALGDCNLLLVGTPENNSYLRRISEQLPCTIEEGVLHAAGRKQLSVRGSVLSFHYFNPEHPHRLIYVVSPYLNETEQQQFVRNPRYFLAGSAGFKMIDQPDLMVRAVSGRIRRESQLDQNWEFITPTVDDVLVPEEFSNRDNLALAHMKVMRRQADVDFALWWGPEDRGLFGGYDFNWLPTYDSTSYTSLDFAVHRRDVETMTAEVTGTEFTDIYDRWVATKELLTWPPVTQPEIDADRRYRIVIPMDLVPKLGGRRSVLSKVAEGPAITGNQIAGEIFGSTD
ncbi:MAG: alpha/beta hydrolase-fold protein [Planctomycetaceae bacterium]